MPMPRDLHQSLFFCQLKEENIQFKPDKSGYHFFSSDESDGWISDQMTDTCRLMLADGSDGSQCHRPDSSYHQTTYCLSQGLLNSFTKNSSKMKSYECINQDDGKDKIAKKMIKFGC